MFQVILAILLTFPPSVHDDETTSARQERVEVIAEAISTAADGRSDVAAFLIMKARRESRLALNIHSGNCRQDQCDGGKARTLWQVWRLDSMTDEEWDSIVGTGLEETTNAAELAARLYVLKKNYCRGDLGAITAYATGRCSVPSSVFSPVARLREMRVYQRHIDESVDEENSER